jgi:hypothetical protein
MLFFGDCATISKKREAIRQGGFGRVVDRSDLAFDAGRALRIFSSPAA